VYCHSLQPMIPYTRCLLVTCNPSSCLIRCLEPTHRKQEKQPAFTNKHWPTSVQQAYLQGLRAG
jgi:hypothetical protein